MQEEKEEREERSEEGGDLESKKDVEGRIKDRKWRLNEGVKRKEK